MTLVAIRFILTFFNRSSTHTFMCVETVHLYIVMIYLDLLSATGAFQHGNSF
jgi:hypothetical protein